MYPNIQMLVYVALYRYSYIYIYNEPVEGQKFEAPGDFRRLAKANLQNGVKWLSDLLRIQQQNRLQCDEILPSRERLPNEQQ